MKLGVATSTVLHAAVIGFGLLSVSSSPNQQIELSGVEIDFETSNESQPVQGLEDAEVKEVPSPKPTEKKQSEPEAKNVGDSKNDEKSKSREKPADRVVEKSATAPNPDQAVKKPDQVPDKQVKEEPTPATQLSRLNDPATPITPETPAEEQPPVEVDEATRQLAALPKNVPVPVAKPKPPKPNTAKTKERKKPQDTPTKKATDAKKEAKQSVSDLIKNNKTTEQAASGGAKASQKQASLGTNTTSFAKRLSRREEDTLIGRISRCSTGQAGRIISDDLRVTIIMELNPDGTFKVNPKGKAKGGTSEERKRFTLDSLRYAKRCAPYDFLPSEKYDTWKQIVVTFHPSKMFE